MTDAEWRDCCEPGRMLSCLRGKASDRKLRLFGCACCRRVWHFLTDESYRRAVEAAEGYADRPKGRRKLAGVHAAACGALQDAWGPAYPAWAAACLVTKAPLRDAPRGVAENTAEAAARGAAEAAYREAEANPQEGDAAARAEAAARDARARAVTAECQAQALLLHDIFGPLPFRPLPPVAPPLLSWNNALVPRLARSAYDERHLPSGHLDAQRIAVLADALEDAGCQDDELLQHLREPGPHVRGCFVIDLLLNRA